MDYDREESLSNDGAGPSATYDFLIPDPEYQSSSDTPQTSYFPPDIRPTSPSDFRTISMGNSNIKDKELEHLSQRDSDNYVIRRKKYKLPSTTIKNEEEDKEEETNLKNVLKKEADQFDGKILLGCMGLNSDSCLRKWELVVEGPIGSPYAGGVFFGNINFPFEYPKVNPSITFSTCIFHPNVDERGNFDMTNLKKIWKPSFNLSNLYQFIHDELMDIKPVAPVCFQQRLADSYKNNGVFFNELIQKTTKKYATIPEEQREVD